MELIDEQDPDETKDVIQQEEPRVPPVILMSGIKPEVSRITQLTLTVLVSTIDAQWEGMGDVGAARYEPALLPPCPTIRVLSYSN